MLGKVITLDTKNLTGGPLGVVQLGFKNYDLGKTHATTVLAPDEDRLAINYQQEGTKEATEVRTGILYTLNTTLSEISTKLLEIVLTGATKQADNSLLLGRNLFTSLRDTEAGVVKVTACDTNGDPSEDIYDTWWFYEGVIMINGDVINWGVDTQRDIPITIKLYYHRFSAGESSTYSGLFGYIGNPVSSDIPAADWNVGPEPTSFEITSATELDVVFDKNVAFQGGSFPAGTIAVKINDDTFVLAVSAAISTTTVTVTFPASTFTAGDVVVISISSTCIEDTESTPNDYPGVNNYPVVNSLV